MKNIIIGCPTRNRTWILPLWKEYVEAAIPEDWEYSFAFVVGQDDMKTMEMVGSWERTNIIPVDEPPIMEDVRTWADTSRFEHMAWLRNQLLGYARFRSPDYLLSLDSDILLHKDVLKNLIETAEQNEADAVGGLTYFDPQDKHVTNIANWREYNAFNSGFKRVREPGVHPVDIIMGIKLLGPEGYNTDYIYHGMGEDLGWSQNMVGKKIFCDGRQGSKHVMHPRYLELEDQRVGY